MLSYNFVCVLTISQEDTWTRVETLYPASESIMTLASNITTNRSTNSNKTSYIWGKTMACRDKKRRNNSSVFESKLRRVCILLNVRSYLNTVQCKLIEKQVEGDGHCQFRALSHLLFDTEEYHFKLRNDAVNYIEEHRSMFTGKMGGVCRCWGLSLLLLYICTKKI